jgi:hypothetical protein
MSPFLVVTVLKYLELNIPFNPYVKITLLDEI